MKNTIFFIASFTMLITGAGAQTYSFTKESGTYTELTGASKLFYDTTSQGYYFSAALKFPALTGTGDFSQNTSVPSNGTYVVNHGYMAVYDFPSYARTIVFQGFYNQNMQLRDATSGVFIKSVGADGSRILKVQWKNIGIKDFPNDYLNFQVWFHEADNSITYHYGASSLTQQTGGFCGMFLADNSFIAVLSNFSLSGSSASPAHSTTAHSFIDLPYLDDFPANGTIYHFTPATTGIPALQTENIKTWPVPATHFLHVSLKEIPAACELNLCDMSGRLLQTVRAQGGAEVTMPMEQLPAGVYLLQVRSEGQVIHKKILHQ